MAAASVPSQSANETIELQRMLTVAHERIEELEKQNNKWRRTASSLQQLAETEEDSISNKLLRRIDEVKAEKARLLAQLEREEQYIASTLQKQLAQVSAEQCAKHYKTTTTTKKKTAA